MCIGDRGPNNFLGGTPSMNLKFDRNMALKVGIVVAVVVIVYLIWRARTCKDTYAMFAPTMRGDSEGYAMFAPPQAPQQNDEYAENMFEDRAADYAEEGDEQIPDMGMGADMPTSLPSPYANDFPIMQSTLDDDEANAMFEPEM